MRAVSLLLIPFFFFLFLSIMPVSAYEVYNENPSFSNSTMSYIIADYGINETYSTPEFFECYESSWETTYESDFENSTGVLLLQNDNCLGLSIDQSSVLITPLDATSYYFKSGNYTAIEGVFEVIDALYEEGLIAVNNYIYTIPANKEEIIYLRSSVNDTTNIRVDYTQIYYTIDDVQYTEQINIEQGNFTDTFVIIEPESYSRTLEVYAGFFYTSPADYSQIAIDTFKIYTFDTAEPRTYWSSNQTYEQIRYCGDNGVGYDGGEVLFESFANGTMAFHICTDQDGNLSAGVFKLGDTTISRRLINEEELYGAEYDLFEFRDMYFFNVLVSTPTFYEFDALITGLSTTEMELTVFNAQHIHNDTEPNAYIFYDAVPKPYGLWMNGTEFASTGIIIDYNQSIRATVDMTSYLNSTAIGSYWAVCGRSAGTQCGSSSSYHEFFGSLETANLCTPSIVCDQPSNSQYLVTANCSIAQTISCENWGCNDDLDGCDYGFIGSYCFNNYSLVTTDTTGASELSYCNITASEQCYNVSSRLGVCLTEEGYINYNATNSNLWTNPSETTAYILGALFDVHDYDSVMNIFGWLLVLIVSAGVTIFYAKESKDGNPTMIFMIVMAVMLVFVSFVLGWIDPWIVILLVILVSLLVAKQMGLFGGG